MLCGTCARYPCRGRSAKACMKGVTSRLRLVIAGQQLAAHHCNRKHRREQYLASIAPNKTTAYSCTDGSPLSRKLATRSTKHPCSQSISAHHHRCPRSRLPRIASLRSRGQSGHPPGCMCLHKEGTLSKCFMQGPQVVQSKEHFRWQHALWDMRKIPMQRPLSKGLHERSHLQAEACHRRSAACGPPLQQKTQA